MRTLLAATAVVALVTLAACGSESGGPVARDPAPTEPARIPAADGLVATRDLVTVMDTGGPGSVPELCLGAVAESYPPQCSGPPIEGWRWADQQGVFEKSGAVRWGLFALTGTWDGETFAVESSIPAALYSPPAQLEEPPPAADGGPAGVDEDAILAKLEADPLPGTLSVVPTAGGIVVDVVYDDGSIQEDATARFGEAVTVTSALVPVAG